MNYIFYFGGKHRHRLTRWTKLTHWRRAVILMSFQSTGDVVTRIKLPWIKRSFLLHNFLSVLEPDVRNMTCWTAAAETFQLCLGIRLMDCYCDHLHLESWICEEGSKMSFVTSKIHTYSQNNLCSSCGWNNLGSSDQKCKLGKVLNIIQSILCETLQQ